LAKIFADGYLRELLLAKHGFAAYLKQEFAFDTTGGWRPHKYNEIIAQTGNDETTGVLNGDES
jgi:hypothetical protein